MILMQKIISVTEAARNFAECVSRAHYQNVTFVLLKGGSPVARIVRDAEKVCTGSELASAISQVKLTSADAGDWERDLREARKGLGRVSDKWR
jgi:antitoxin (DNA-binding transcriptional repressor) of toxin-antitoxin stability system